MKIAELKISFTGPNSLTDADLERICDQLDDVADAVRHAIEDYVAAQPALAGVVGFEVEE